MIGENKMKKIYSLLLVLCLIFLLSACGGNETATDNDTGSSTAQNQTDMSQQEPAAQFDELKNIIDYNGYYNLFITNDGALYKIGNFSDGKKLRRIGEGVKFVKFSVGAIISDNNDVYIYNEDDFSVSLFNNGVGYTLNTTIPGDDYLNSAHIIRYPGGPDIAAYVKENEVFLYQEENSPSSFYTSTQKGPIYKFDDDETIIYFIDGTIKTNKGYYCFKETVNTSQYDDIPRTYTYSLEKITDVNEDIIFLKRFDDRCLFYQDYRVDKNGNLFEKTY